MSRVGATKGSEKAKEAEVNRLIADAQDTFEKHKAKAEQQEARERAQRCDAVFVGCRSNPKRGINEPALWFRVPDHHGAMFALVTINAALRAMEPIVQRHMAERGVHVPEGTVKV